jgi:CRISPR/Cas system-associated protein Csx1
LTRDVAGGRGTQRGSLSTPTLLSSEGDEGFSQVCGTVRNMIDALYEALPQVRALIDAGRIQLQDFEHTRYNGCEIIS